MLDQSPMLACWSKPGWTGLIAGMWYIPAQNNGTFSRPNQPKRSRFESTCFAADISIGIELLYIIYHNLHILLPIHIYIMYMGLLQNSGKDRPAVIQTYGSVWITCVLVSIGGMDRPVGSGYGSGLYILTRSYIYIFYYKYIYIIYTYVYIYNYIYIYMCIIIPIA